MDIIAKKILGPKKDHSGETILLTDKTYEERYKKVLQLMEKYNISTLVVYADKEHGSNFEYLTGFIPRFEEGLQIITIDGTSTLLLGNENFNKIKYSRIESDGILIPLFSLPNQPMNNYKPFDSYLEDLKIDTSGYIGFVDWKILTEDLERDTFYSAVPSFIVDAFRKNFTSEKLINASHLYISPDYGARVTNNANEIARYEYGASLASDALLDAYDKLEEGISEIQVGDQLNKNGQYQSVVTISAFGDRFINANLYPTENKLKYGDKVSLTVGYKGGLSSRAGYAVNTREDLDSVDPEYFDKVVVPYFKAYIYWLDNVKIGIEGGEFFDKFNKIYSQNNYGWNLNPGHLTADEEWMSSPFYKGSKSKVKSGMIFQVDFIPIQPPHQGVSAESTVAIADDDLINDIKSEYPKLWDRIEVRRSYLENNLNIKLDKSLLPLSSTLGYLRPFMLNREYALVVDK